MSEIEHVDDLRGMLPDEILAVVRRERERTDQLEARLAGALADVGRLTIACQLMLAELEYIWDAYSHGARTSNAIDAGRLALARVQTDGVTTS